MDHHDIRTRIAPQYEAEQARAERLSKCLAIALEIVAVGAVCVLLWSVFGGNS
jgi:hypothetical protein